MRCRLECRTWLLLQAQREAPQLKPPEATPPHHLKGSPRTSPESAVST
ncbi:hypothetical protein ABTF10_18915 [Acinetobacter baumannii]